ncbi:MAG: hypothetical protein K6G78_06805 [bacterium]|nr:hypothetical protein [Coriobacteriales bacterium]MCR5846254.1 hypothetical protein [bacterium]
MPECYCCTNCNSCGKLDRQKVSFGRRYCPYCKEEAPDNEVTICPNCGKQLPPPFPEMPSLPPRKPVVQQ